MHLGEFKSYSISGVPLLCASCSFIRVLVVACVNLSLHQLRQYVKLKDATEGIANLRIPGQICLRSLRSTQTTYKEKKCF